MAFAKSLSVPPPRGMLLDEPMQTGGMLYVRAGNGVVAFGSLQARPGLTSFAALAEAARGFFAVRATSDGNIRTVIATTKRWYGLNAAGAAVDIGGGVNLTAVNIPTTFVYWIQSGADAIIGVNDTDAPKTWDLNTADAYATLANAPIARSVAVATSRLVFGRTKESGTLFARRVRWSLTGDNTTYPTGAFVDLVDTTGQVVAVRALGRNAVVAYKEDAQYVGFAVDNTTDAKAFQFNMIERQPGPVGPGAIDDGPGGVTHAYFATDGNLYLFNGSRVTLLFELANTPLVANNLALSTTTLTLTMLRYFAAKQQIWILFPNGEVVIYSLKTDGIFSGVPGVALTALGNAYVENLAGSGLYGYQLLAGSAAKAYTVSGATDDGTGISLDWELLLPPLAGEEYEFDRVTAHFGPNTTTPVPGAAPNVTITISVKVGTTFDSLPAAWTTLGTINPSTGTDPNPPNSPGLTTVVSNQSLRGKVVVIRMTATDSVGVNLRYLEVGQFVRKMAS